MSVPVITLEDHFCPQIMHQIPALQKELDGFPARILEALYDVDSQRLTSMDAGHISVQVISHGPGASSQPISYVAAANDELHRATQAHPQRYAGFAALPMVDPEDAVKELERCVKELGFVGALLDNHLTDGQYYDAKKYWPVFAKAQELDVPIYLHPTNPVEAVKKVMFDGEWADPVAQALGAFGWGWHADTGLHVLRLHASGLFDAYPRVKVVVGHMGEMLPYMLERVKRCSSVFWMEGKRRSFQDVWDENVWITTSSFFSLDPMACLLRNTKLDHIMYSVDYPFSKNEAGWEFLEKLRDSGMVSREVFEGIAFKNAEKLLKLQAVSA